MKIFLTEQQYNFLMKDYKITFKKLTTDQMKQFLYGGGFLPKNPERYFNKERFHYFAEDRERHSSINKIEFIWYTLWEGKEMLAVAKVGDYKEDGITKALNYIDVDSLYREKGLAKKLADYVFEDFAKNKWTFETSFYSEMGEKYIKPLFNELAKKYKLKFIDREGMDYIIKDYSK